MFICFIGSRGETFINFYGTHGLGDYFLLLLKMKYLGKIQKFGFTVFYTVTRRFCVSVTKAEKYE